MAADLIDEDQASLFDLIDDLAALGIQQEVSLPQLIVCGDQSVGKSSLLEAISGLKFPVDAGQCTRFPIQISLRRSHTESYHVHVRPGPSATKADIEMLNSFSPHGQTVDDLNSTIIAAAKLMGIDSRKPLSDNVLVIEASRPECPNLTLVDLPGLVASTPDAESRDQIRMTRDLVSSYMANTDSIILAVVSAETHYQNQGVLDLAKQHDESGARTMAIVTKPDLNTGKAVQKRTIHFAQNKINSFRLGCHVVRNADSDVLAPHATGKDQDAEEAKFFRSPPWNDLDPAQCGIPALKAKLKGCLATLISKVLPQLCKSIDTKLQEHQSNLQMLGSARDSRAEQHDYLSAIARRFETSVNDGLDPYKNIILGRKGTALRPQIERLKRSFCDNIQYYGASFDITCASHDQFALRTNAERALLCSPHQNPELQLDYTPPPLITCEDHATDIQERILEECKGMQLVTVVDPGAIWCVMNDLSTKWPEIVNDHLELIYDRVHTFVFATLGEIANEHTCDLLLDCVINSRLNEMKSELTAKAAELMIPHTELPPVSFNPALATKLEEILRQKLVGEPSKKDPFSAAASGASFMVVHQVYAYYRNAQSTMVDNITILAVENSLIRGLRSLFTTETVDNMSSDELSLIGSEPIEAIDHRLFHSQMCDRLDEALNACRKYQAKSRSRTTLRPKMESATPRTSPAASGTPRVVPPLTPNRSPSPPTSRLATPGPVTPSPHTAKSQSSYKAPQVSDLADNVAQIDLSDDEL